MRHHYEPLEVAPINLLFPARLLSAHIRFLVRAAILLAVIEPAPSLEKEEEE